MKTTFRDHPTKSFKDTDLFKPIQVGDLELGQRIVMAPMGRLRNVNQVPSSHLMAEYYRQRSQYKGTLLITEGTFISREAGTVDGAPGIYTREQIEAWKPIHKAVHDNGSYIFQQLWALGWQASPDVLAKNGIQYVGPSSDNYMDESKEKLAKAGENPIKGLTVDGIKQYVQNYVQAAKNALEAGADGVETHSAGGYLLNEFLDPRSNKRTDEYGGSIENRSRFLLEVIDAVTRAIGSNKVGVKFFPYMYFGGMSGKKDPGFIATYSHVYSELEKRGLKGDRIAYISFIEPRVTNPLSLEGEEEESGSNDFIYDIWKGNVIRAGNYAHYQDSIVREITRPNTLICFGRVFVSNPDLVERLERGLPLNQYDRDTFYTPTAVGYTDYPIYEEAVKNNM